jgi:hypothetical protein
MRPSQDIESKARRQIKFWLPSVVLLLVTSAMVALAQQNTSLGDVARQSRAQKPADGQGASSKAQDLADEMEREQEETGDAPPGFKSYNATGYRLWVPFPYEIQARDNNGVVLASSLIGGTKSLVLVGNPIPFAGDNSEGADATFRNVAQQFARTYGPWPGCGKITVAKHAAFSCTVNSNMQLTGEPASGSVTLVRGSSSLFPVMCLVPITNHGREAYNDRRNYDKRNAVNDMVREDRDTRNSWQACDLVMKSIRLKEDEAVHPATISGMNKPSKSWPPAAAAPAGSTPDSTPSSTPDNDAPGSLAALARQTRQGQRPRARAVLDNAEGKSPAPAGFRSFPITFCEDRGQGCREASIVIPEKAEEVSGVNGQYVFRSKLDDKDMMLYAGPADVRAPYRSMTNPYYIQIRDLANPNGWSREKADDVSLQEITVDGKPAIVTRFRFHGENKAWWIGERILTESRGTQFLLGCSAPEAHFADAEAICTTLVNSLRLP